ncbi:MAG: transketolase C-terminal domain-containing protein, partial [Candidatus Omnitrophica bacterium]|nr:transketolase C-terminal domain-containing protein [Candidatus Omnitrophota bacterium]
NVMNIKGPRILHVVTKKGKGCSFAEKDPVKFHGVNRFNINTGEGLAGNAPVELKSYTEVFRDKIVELAHKEKRLVAVTAAMPEGSGLNKFRDVFPERFFDVGIAESHAVCFAAGLARHGFKPVVAVYSTFLQRAYDQMIEDVALQGLPVIFAVDRAGIVGEDGVTHQGIFDIVYLRSVPNLTVMAPKDGRELREMLEFAFSLNKPVAIRYPRANTFVNTQAATPLDLGKAELLREGKDFTIIALGSMVSVAQEAVKLLDKDGITGSLINARFAAPLDIELMKKVCADTDLVCSMEEGVREGGFGSAISQELGRRILRMGLPPGFIPHGPRDLLLEKNGLSASGVAGMIRKELNR